MQKKRGIAIIVRNEIGQILLMQRGEKASSEQGYWENPGGGVEVGETAEQAAKREVREELGVELEITRLIYSDEFPSKNRSVLWVIDVFEGRISGEPTIQEPDKCSGIKWVSIDELGNLPLATYTKPDFVRLGWLRE